VIDLAATSSRHPGAHPVAEAAGATVAPAHGDEDDPAVAETGVAQRVSSVGRDERAVRAHEGQPGGVRTVQDASGAGACAAITSSASCRQR
jgi:hypothetical protein